MFKATLAINNIAHPALTDATQRRELFFNSWPTSLLLKDAATDSLSTEYVDLVDGLEVTEIGDYDPTASEDNDPVVFVALQDGTEVGAVVFEYVKAY